VHEGRAASEVLQIVDDLGGGPVLSADEFAADDAVAVDDVGFGGGWCQRRVLERWERSRMVVMPAMWLSMRYWR